ncbi:MAG: 2-amino-4-hydroxy-6-hydroxymethyldihydropteridine diphosphokinase [Synergistaceae bacterium]|jgi:2-amino-4-hydroxy-6-hydroxymethyldihydropteridine diphosphokinase|nr:2-amino-4-hydroxy-6-hydroxymethyldihydropteridine diphosphokinase [Synergistaceae bacterium]
MTVVAAVGLGSNLGNRLLNLRNALRHVKTANPGALQVLQTSDVFETPPWGVTDQPHFLNACLTAECALSPEELLALLKDIEAKMGRKETRRWGERMIDLDILAMGSLIYSSSGLRVPHADMHRRSFVLVPLAQVLPDWIHPVTNRSVAEMTEDFDKDGFVRICRL